VLKASNLASPCPSVCVVVVDFFVFCVCFVVCFCVLFFYGILLILSEKRTEMLCDVSFVMCKLVCILSLLCSHVWFVVP